MTPYRTIGITVLLCLAVTSARADSLSLNDVLARAVAHNPLLT